MEAPNLVELPRDNMQSINPDKVSQGLKKLGHISQKVISPNLTLNPSRDLGYYRETEAIFNVLRDNDNMMRLSLNSQTAEQLRCQGTNSVKDYLSLNKYDETTGVDSETGSPSRFRKPNLNTQISSDQLGHYDLRKSEYSTTQMGNVMKSAVFSGGHRRPRTGVTSTHARNNTLLNSAQMSNKQWWKN